MADQYEPQNGAEDYAATGDAYAQGDYGQAEEQGEQAVSAEESPGDKINASKNDDDERQYGHGLSEVEAQTSWDRKIFVGGLSWETTVKDLKDYFLKFGDVVDCTLKTDPNTGRSRGFGFVLFAASGSVDKVVGEKSHLLHGRNIDPKRAKARGGREPIKKVFVGGLDPDTPETEIRDHFQAFGKIEEIDLPFDKQKNQRRAFCFITFESEEVVDRVCEVNKQLIGGKEVDVKKATPKNDQYGYGGRGGRGGYGGRGGWEGGRGRGGYGNQGWGGNQGYDYNNYYNQGYGGYDNYYGGYGGYDYNNYYNQGWGNYNQGYGNYSGSGYGQGED